MKLGAEYTFEAAHWLPLVAETHKCRRMHGHNFRIVVTISGCPDARGFVMDYADLDAAVQPFIDQLDHRCLNDIKGLENPTSEQLAHWLKDRIAAKIPYIPTVRVYETPRYWVET